MTEGDDGSITETQIQKEISNAIQVVPSLVTDFGKYILFSHCRYTLNETELSEKAIAACREFIESKNLLYPDNQAYMIRKSDGALFDLSGQDIFEYRSIQNEHPDLTYKQGYQHYIPQFSYLHSPSGNLYSLKHSDAVYVYKISDNGNAIDVTQVTQGHDTSVNYDMGYRFGVDKNDNVYLSEGGHIEHVYFSDGQYGVLPQLIRNDVGTVDFQTDNDGNLYLFKCDMHEHSEEGADGISIPGMETTIHAFKLDGDNCIVRDTLLLFGDYKSFTQEVSLFGAMWDDGNLGLKYPQFIGYSDNSFSWVITGCRHLDHYLSTKETFIGVLSYNIDLDELTYEDRSELADKLLEEYDIASYGVKCYGVKVGESSVEVREIDIVENTSRTYTLDAPMPSSVLNNYYIYNINGAPYLTISGHSTNGGMETSFTINLINGENNSSFGSDSRKVVSFFRIN